MAFIILFYQIYSNYLTFPPIPFRRFGLPNVCFTLSVLGSTYGISLQSMFSRCAASSSLSVSGNCSSSFCINSLRVSLILPVNGLLYSGILFVSALRRSVWLFKRSIISSVSAFSNSEYFRYFHVSLLLLHNKLN